MEPKVNNDSKPKWTKEEQDKIDKALREAALEAEIERQLREKRWSASPSDKGDTKKT